METARQLLVPKKIIALKHLAKILINSDADISLLLLLHWLNDKGTMT